MKELYVTPKNIPTRIFLTGYLPLIILIIGASAFRATLEHPDKSFPFYTYGFIFIPLITLVIGGLLRINLTLEKIQLDGDRLTFLCRTSIFSKHRLVYDLANLQEVLVYEKNFWETTGTIFIHSEQPQKRKISFVEKNKNIALLRHDLRTEIQQVNEKVVFYKVNRSK